MKKIITWPSAIIASLAIVIAVNLFMLYKAVESNDGLTDENYYEKGLQYEARLSEERELGWNIEFMLDEDASAGRSAAARVNIVSSEGLPLTDAEVKIILSRPATDKHDIAYRLMPSGLSYVCSMTMPLPGFWDVKVIAGKDGAGMEKVFRIRV